MTKTVLINKNGVGVEKQFRDIKHETIYKKCGFSNDTNFSLIHSFKCKDNYVHVFGKDKGKAGDVNKFEYPPPMDNTLYYGNMLLLATEEKELNCDKIINYNIGDWRRDYDYLMGGFEDLEDSNGDDDESDELDEYDDEQKTKNGYLKDDFVVDDEDDDDENSLYMVSELEEESYEDEGDDENVNDENSSDEEDDE